jgi:hypothetical protein
VAVSEHKKNDRGSLVDIAHGEKVEQEFDAMTERRSRKKDPDEEHELRKDSVGQYDDGRQEDNRLAWCDNFSSHLVGSLKARTGEYDRRGALLGDRGEGIR